MDSDNSEDETRPLTTVNSATLSKRKKLHTISIKAEPDQVKMLIKGLSDFLRLLYLRLTVISSYLRSRSPTGVLAMTWPSSVLRITKISSKICVVYALILIG